MKIDASIRMKPYIIIADVIDRAVRNGYHRSFKYDSNPGKEYVIDTIRNEIMADLCEVIDFEHENQG